jgi:hypothetical protein
MSVDGGYITSPATPDIIVHTFTGKVGSSSFCQRMLPWRLKQCYGTARGVLPLYISVCKVRGGCNRLLHHRNAAGSHTFEAACGVQPSAPCKIWHERSMLAQHFAPSLVPHSPCQRTPVFEGDGAVQAVHFWRLTLHCHHLTCRSSRLRATLEPW